ncbi:hypothetical protein BT93_L3534 [Corymbia citriodora subsp. variegata]|uniref:Uncharacterized protein n=1 Tax=Corymbia citriodora subsp. variegata TaxID=360336 RepID=A0A8T0CH19_CORYI|nr:hypothetical protein BT93_L3534 [Corymbia citriodora subsp. variegata]
MSLEQLMESLTLDVCGLDHNNALIYQPQAAVFAQPESMNSLPQLETPDECASDYISSPTYQPQAGAEEGLSFFDFVLGWGDV